MFFNVSQSAPTCPRPYHLHRFVELVLAKDYPVRGMLLIHSAEAPDDFVPHLNPYFVPVEVLESVCCPILVEASFAGELVPLPDPPADNKDQDTEEDMGGMVAQVEEHKSVGYYYTQFVCSNLALQLRQQQLYCSITTP